MCHHVLVFVDAMMLSTFSEMASLIAHVKYWHWATHISSNRNQPM